MRHEKKGRMNNMLHKLATAALLVAGFALAACSSAPEYRKASEGGVYKVGKPYQAAGRWYYPREDKYYNKVGIASWYGPQFHQLRTANGELYDMNELTAAHTTLPMPSFVRVTNLENGRSVILRINDRGPFVDDRIIDVSRRAAQLLGFIGPGTARVRVEAVTPDGDTPVEEAKAEPVPAHNPDDGPIMPAVPPPSVEKTQLAALPPDPDAAANTSPDAGNSAGEVFVQAGSFSAYGNAERLAGSLKHLGAVTLSSIKVEGRNWFRVRIGPFRSMGEANATLGKIVARGLGGARIVVD
jgi:rare lipoprotein A